MQSHKHSLYEAIINTFIGFWISFLGQLVIYPAYGAKFTIMDNLHIGIWFMFLSLIRSYVIRRWFNGLIFKAADRLAGE
jgi:hypothetical protein